jgi:hypothetical protein
VRARVLDPTTRRQLIESAKQQFRLYLWIEEMTHELWFGVAERVAGGTTNVGQPVVRAIVDRVGLASRGQDRRAQRLSTRKPPRRRGER